LTRAESCNFVLVFTHVDTFSGYDSKSLFIVLLRHNFVWWRKILGEIVAHMPSFGVPTCPCSLNALEISFIQSILQLKPVVLANEIVQYAASLYCAIAVTSNGVW